MSSDDDNQLKDLVSQTLENKGILSKIRAELRANVFLALEGNEKFKEQLRNNQLIVDLLKTEEGVLALCIVQEFLEFCNLKFTRTILETEIGVPSSQINSKSRQQLMSDLKLKQENNTLPVLCQLLEANSQHLSNKDQISKTSSIAPDENQDQINKKLVNGENLNEESRLKEKSRSPEEQLILDLNLRYLNGSQEDEPASPLLLDHLPSLHKPNTNFLANTTKLINTINDLNQDPPPILDKGSPAKNKGGGDTGSVSEIEEDLDSAEDLLNSSGSLRDDVTQDNSISTLSSGIGDYMEDVNHKVSH
ncbi:hypothetical protein M8J75_008247 [Diaphorina citri]|nr:hypothetical protein M8J75_008247 [Diaphorina citri]